MINVAAVHDPDYHLREVTHDPSAYYARTGEAPGRWAGDGAAALGLGGEVTPVALHDLFAGKDPTSGRYLLSARGSSGRAAARQAEVSVDVTEAAGRLGLSATTVRRRLRTGQLPGVKDARGQWHIPVTATDDHLAGHAQPAVPLAVGVSPSSTYTLPEAAAVAGVNVSYLRRIATDTAPAEPVRPDSKAVQYLLGTRDSDKHWQINGGELARYLAHRTRARVVPAYDLAVRAPKSVSILHALGHTLPKIGGRSVTAEVLAAHHAAVDDTVSFLERHAGFVRGPGGRIAAKGLTVAVFDHRTSRTGDPLLHSHLVVANAAEAIDGRRGALDGTALYQWARAAGHVYQARLRAELGARLGIAFDTPHNGTADIAGFPRGVIDAFSERRHQILQHMAALGTAGAGAAQVATMATRAAKHDVDALVPDQIASIAADLGFGPDQLAGLLGRHRVPATDTNVAQAAERLASPDGLCARATRIDWRDAVCGLANELPDGATADQLERGVTGLLADPRRFVPVVATVSRGELIRRADGLVVTATGGTDTWTTPELLDHETTLVALHQRGLGPDGTGIGTGMATETAVTAAVAARQTLRAEQARMVKQLCRSGIGIDVVVGGPGTGKTFAVGAAAEAWRACGYQVIGAALQGGAAEVLATEAGLDHQYTLTALLARCGHHGVDFLAGAVVIVDEAGMADTRQLSRLATYATAAGAKLVLIGDPAQIPEVGAGGAFAHLAATTPPDALVVLSENHRQRHQHDRDRLVLIKHGDAAAAIESAKTHGRWHQADTATELRARLLTDWHTDPGLPGTDKLLVATTVAEVEHLNAAARALLIADGTLGATTLTITLSAPDRAVDARQFRVGDRVRATRNHYPLGVFTGRVGTVIALDGAARSVTVALDAATDPSGAPRPARTVTLDAAFLHERTSPTRPGQIERPGLTHAYASTANAVQGRTAQRAYVLITEAGMYRQAAYVALSRARDTTHLYGLTVPDPDDIVHHQHHGATPPPDPADTDALAAAMARDAAQTMASVADPLAAPAGRLIGQPVPWLYTHRHDLTGDTGINRANQIRAIHARLAAAYHLPLDQLECKPLTDAINRALDVPGATPARVATLMLRRHQAVTRELATAEDPIAVLVWAAGTHATNILRAEVDTTERAPDLHATEALRVVDAAIARQRASRLAAAEADPDSPITAAVGPLPDTAAGRVAWRRAAAAIVDYRDAAGLYDRDDHHPDPITRALGNPVGDRGLAAQRAAALDAIVATRAAVVLAQLTRHVPNLGPRPDPAIAALAELPLPQLRQLAATPPDHLDETRPSRSAVMAAIQHRQARLRADSLTNPTDEVRAALASDVTAAWPLPVDVAHLVTAIADLAVAADEAIAVAPVASLVDQARRTGRVIAGRAGGVSLGR